MSVDLETMLEQCCFGDTSKINHLELALAVREVLAERDALAKDAEVISLTKSNPDFRVCIYRQGNGDAYPTWWVAQESEIKEAITAMKGTPT